jgi:hypothetical protein
MTKKISLQEMSDLPEEVLNDIVKRVVPWTEGLLKKGTPVDTGRLRANWQIGENTDSGPMIGKGSYNTSKPVPLEQASRASIGTGKARRVNYQREKIGPTYSIFNNLPYAEPNILGTNYPPSWGGNFKSRENQVQKGWFHSVEKQVKDKIQSFRWED